MSRVALACLLLLLAGCGAAGSTAHQGSSRTATTATTATASTGLPATPASSTAPPGPWRGATAEQQFLGVAAPFVTAMNAVTADTNAFGGQHLPTKQEFPSVWAPIVAKCAAASDAASTAISTIDDARQKHYWPASALPALASSERELRWYIGLMKQCPTMHSTGEVVAWYLHTDTRRKDAIRDRLADVVKALASS